MKYFFTYKKNKSDEARIRTYDTREEAVAKWLEMKASFGIAEHNTVDFGVDDDHCVAKSLIFWNDQGYYKPEPLYSPERKILLPKRN